MFEELHVEVWLPDGYTEATARRIRRRLAAACQQAAPPGARVTVSY